MTAIEAKCPECGQKVTLTLGPTGNPSACPGCSVDIDPNDFFDISHSLHDLLHKTVPADIPDDLLTGALKGLKTD